MRIPVLILVAMLIPTPAWAQRKKPAEPGRPLSQDILFYEGFDDAKLLNRGWYDGKRFSIVKEKGCAGKGCIEYAWKEGASTPHTSSGIRHLFEPTDEVYLTFKIKLSKNWEWSGKPYHPHLMHFMTTENESYRGPASSHLTLYVEPWDGKLRLAAQDIENKDLPHGLTQGPIKGGYNGTMFDSKDKLLVNDQWHLVRVKFKLNSLDLEADKANADGKIWAFLDDNEVIERNDIIFRTTDFPSMQFNQFLLTPYFGPGLLPHAQTLWIDELVVSNKSWYEDTRAGRRD
jgi:hypothetical protein